MPKTLNVMLIFSILLNIGLICTLVYKNRQYQYNFINVQGEQYAQNMKNFEFDLKKIKYDVQNFGEDGITSNVILRDDQLLMVFHINVPIGKVASEQENQIIQVHQNLKTLIKTKKNSDKLSALDSINLLINNIDQINQKMKNKSNYYWYTQLHPN